ncbi:DUF4251 domain-containing protein [Aestuariivivens sediminis]|uniref:DUF4251 domain-containing protein n=1 Tax=Aestuariivivens sediminis TaxID=2913557 RepID=UPI001F59B12A|nr:DUF4251 domain-containing protein [Aestuariivivens sediminis]
MKRVIPLRFLSILLLVACASTKPTASAEELEALETIVSSGTFEVESNFAYPQVSNAVQQVLNSGLLQPGSNAGGISLIGNPNYLRIRNDSVFSYLPYFGERRMRAGYGSGDGAIQLKSILSDYTINKNKNGSYRINFSADGQSENYRVVLDVFPNLKTSMLLNGVYRLPIQYSGTIKQLKME